MQEDAHISNLNIDGKHTALFSVFDGHGGKAVAKFAAKHMPYWLVRMEAYKRQEYGVAIAESYYKMDELLDSEEGQAELKSLVGATKAPKRDAGGLFADIEAKLHPEAKEKNESTAAAEKEEQGDDSDAAAPSKPERMKRTDSSEAFRKSALQRHSVIMPSMNTTDSELEKLDSLILPKDHPLPVGASESDDGSESDLDPHSATGMGCTAVSVLIHHNKVTVANTGDSRCVMSRRGEAVPLTLDHKPIIYEEAQRIIRAGGFVRDNRVNGALNVSRTLGDLDFKRNVDLPHTEQMVVATPDITDLELREGDEFLILACDGIWDVMSNQEAVDFARKRIRQGQSLKSICEQMCDFCLAPDLKGMCRGADNMSVILVLFRKHQDLESFWYRIWSNFTGIFKKDGK
jgi:serine/threonine protein phosphatase PrpC